ncbi:MAG: flippase-like domain-containing protein [Actinobacteria bacterium]|nr:flippase-like domain-containing protein [Actinomycetota bacterium]
MNNLKFNKEKIFIAIRIVVSVSLLSYLIIRNYSTIKNLIPALKGFNHYYFIAAVLLFALGIFITMLRWDILLRARGIFIFKGFLLQSYYVGYFYSNILPSNIGGDIYRPYDLHKSKGVDLHKNLSVIIMERFIASVVGTLSIFISFFLIYKYISIKIIIGFLLLPVLMFIIFLIIIRPDIFKLYRLFAKFRRLKNLEKKFNEFRNSFFEFKNKLKFIFASIAAAIAAHLIFITSYWFANLYARVNLNFTSFFFLNPVIILSANIPVSVGGIGVRENITVVILKQFGIADYEAVIFTLVILAIIILNTLAGGIIYLIRTIFYKNRAMI